MIALFAPAMGGQVRRALGVEFLELGVELVPTSLVALEFFFSDGDASVEDQALLGGSDAGGDVDVDVDDERGERAAVYPDRDGG